MGCEPLKQSPYIWGGISRLNRITSEISFGGGRTSRMSIRVGHACARQECLLDRHWPLQSMTVALPVAEYRLAPKPGGTLERTAHSSIPHREQAHNPPPAAAD